MLKAIFNLQNPWRNNREYKFVQRKRTILSVLINNLENRKIIGIIGSRQVGKSSIIYLLINHLLKHSISERDIFYFNLDDIYLKKIFTDISLFLDFIGDLKSKKYIFIDEIQRMESPGLFLKELYDLNKNIKIIYSGSSQLEIKSKVREHLVGRVRTFIINRLSFSEYLDFSSPTTKDEAFNNILLYGTYPEVALLNSSIERKLLLKDITQLYIEKDIVDFMTISHIDAFNKLLILLANNIGQLLSIDNISKHLKLKREKVEEYIFILENTFMVKRIYPFHKNYNKEIIKTPKIFFSDLGIRNFIINNFQELNLRNDVGSLFETFFYNEYKTTDFYGLSKINYWRTTNQTEIDFIINNGKKTYAIECKLSDHVTPRSFKTIKNYYPDFKTVLINKDNFLNEIEPPVI